MSKNAGLVHSSLALLNMTSAAQYLMLHASNPQHIDRTERRQLFRTSRFAPPLSLAKWVRPMRQRVALVLRESANFL
jgi:hypothetical protein